MATAAPSNSAIRGLFDGAIQCELPERFVDTAQFRQIPDHQFVFSDAELDQQVIVEVNTYSDNIPDEECAMFFWNDYIEVNDAKEMSPPQLFTPVCH